MVSLPNPSVLHLWYTAKNWTGPILANYQGFLNRMASQPPVKVCEYTPCIQVREGIRLQITLL